MTDELLDDLAQVMGEYREDLEADVSWARTPDDETARSAAPQVTPQVRRLVVAIGRGEASATELRRWLGLSDAKSFRLLYLRKAIDAGLVEMTIPDRPQSRNQTYRLTGEGRVFLDGLKQREATRKTTDH